MDEGVSVDAEYDRASRSPAAGVDATTRHERAVDVPVDPKIGAPTDDERSTEVTGDDAG